MADEEPTEPQQAAEEPQAEEQQAEEQPAEEQQEQAAPAEEAPAEGEATAGEPGAAEEPAGEMADDAGEGQEQAQETEEAPPAAEDAPKTEEEPAGGGEGETPAEEGAEKPAEGTEGEGAPPEEGEKPEGEEQAAAEEEGQAKEGGEEAEKPPEETGAEGEEGEGEKAAEGEEGEAPKEGEEGEAPKEEGEAKEGEEGEKPEGEPGEGEEAAAEKPEGEAEDQTPVPQSDTFAEGERPESPVVAGERLSREGSALERPSSQVGLEYLPPGTPERAMSDVAETEIQSQPEAFPEDQEHDPEFDREVLIEKYHAALGEREALQQQNMQLQNKLAEYFRKKKADERQDYDKNVADQEQRYLKYMAQLEDLHRQDAQEQENYHMQIVELREKCEDKKSKVDEERQVFLDFMKQVAMNAINSRSGKGIPQRDIEQYIANEIKKEAEVVNVRLENIKLKNKLKKKEQQLKSKEELAEGLHLIDFEQLKIENQTYNEKIEERNEELLKLRKKITSTVQVLTHLKEKLQFVQAENQVQKTHLREVEALVAQKRDVLSRTKQARDSLRIDNQKLRQNCGLLGNEMLLRDFEEQKDESDELREKLEKLRAQHAELTLNCNQVRRKIEQARTSRT